MITLIAVILLYLIGCFFTYLRLCSVFYQHEEDLCSEDKIAIFLITSVSWLSFLTLFLIIMPELLFHGSNDTKFFRFGLNEKEWFSKEKPKKVCRTCGAAADYYTLYGDNHVEYECLECYEKIQNRFKIKSNEKLLHRHQIKDYTGRITDREDSEPDFSKLNW